MMYGSTNIKFIPIYTFLKKLNVTQDSRLT